MRRLIVITLALIGLVACLPQIGGGEVCQCPTPWVVTETPSPIDGTSLPSATPTPSPVPTMRPTPTILPTRDARTPIPTPESLCLFYPCTYKSDGAKWEALNNRNLRNRPALDGLWVGLVLGGDRVVFTHIYQPYTSTTKEQWGYIESTQYVGWTAIVLSSQWFYRKSANN